MVAPEAQNVDIIWEAMKADQHLLIPSNSTNADLSVDMLCSPRRARKGSKKKKKKQRSDSKTRRTTERESGRASSHNRRDLRTQGIGSSVGVSNLEGQTQGSSNIPRSEDQNPDEPPLTSELLLALEETDAAGYETLDLGDSDDDDDNRGNIHQTGVLPGEKCSPRPPKSWRLDRFVSKLQSDDGTVRTETLRAIKTAIETLSAEVPQLAPALKFDPPYDTSTITLTHKQRGGVVSDMASGSHVPRWSQWERTHAPLLSQFRDDAHKLEEGDVTDADRTLIGHGDNEATAPTRQLQLILDSCGKSLFRRFADKIEKCRSLALECVQLLCLAALDLRKHVPYLMPALISRHRLASYDAEMEVFVLDKDQHERYKRGGATERQDRTGLLTRSNQATVEEASEEVRLSLCELISCVLRGAIAAGSFDMLDPYFTDILFALHSHVRDPFPALKALSAMLLVQVLRISRWEAGAKHFATGIAREALVSMRHRNSKVRIAALELFQASVSVPNREKIKGAGSDAIVDIVGYREENVLPIAAFYKSECSISVNVLAELVADKNPSVRARCCEMLAFFIVCLPDRYDHQQRLLPYLLSFYHDTMDRTKRVALTAIEACGEQYEAEHPDEIIERLQYGVDGDARCNHVERLPPPFDKRPRLGARIFVRGNTKRFFAALLHELSSWVSASKEQSTQLLQILVVYCEEHLTMDFHQTLPLLVKALRMSRDSDNERANATQEINLLEILTLIGRYVDPDTYVPLLTPRVLGDANSSTTYSEGGSHSEASRAANAAALAALIRGSLPKQLLPHALPLMSLLCCDVCVGKYAGTRAKLECVATLVVLLERVRDSHLSGAVTAHYLTTGRLAHLSGAVSSCRQFLLNEVLNTQREDMVALAKRGIAALPEET